MTPIAIRRSNAAKWDNQVSDQPWLFLLSWKANFGDSAGLKSWRTAVWGKERYVNGKYITGRDDGRSYTALNLGVEVFVKHVSISPRTRRVANVHDAHEDILIPSSNLELLLGKDWILSPKIMLHLLYRSLFMYGMLSLFIDVNCVSAFWFHHIGSRFPSLGAGGKSVGTKV
jgi:hypothetical protein